MSNDVKKAVFQAIVSSEDYLQAFEQLSRLGLKKTQQREIIRVLFHCCLSEKSFNAFYALLCQRFIKFDPTNYRYTVKYAIWDYLKGLDTLSIKKVLNLSRLCGFLLAHEDIPLHFLKVIDFSSNALTKPTVLFLHLLLQAVLDEAADEDKLRTVFVKGLRDEGQKNASFVTGLAKFVLGKFYKRLSKQYVSAKMPKELQAKLMALMKSLKSLQTD